MILCLSGNAFADRCSILRTDETPCDIRVGEPAPYTGTLMTESTARSLADKVFDVQSLELRLELLTKLRAIDAKTNADLVTKLKEKIEDAPHPFYESPWFWIGTIGAFAGGVWLGSQL